MNRLETFFKRADAARDDVEADRTSVEATLDAPIAAASDWWVKVRDAAYGPYTRDQLVHFIEEGRVRPNTQVSRLKDGPWKEARAHAELFVQPKAANEHGAEEAANLFVFAEIHSGAWSPFLAALETLGRVCEIAPGLWIVRTRRSAGVMRNTLSQTLERGDRFVVIDATRDRLAWFNLGPETDARIKEVWNAAPRA